MLPKQERVLELRWMKFLKKVLFLYNPQTNEVESVDKKEIFDSVSNMEETNW